MKFEQKLALEASAGSGKTFALVVRYITLLFLGANPRTILALTFTNKSALEMRVRIFKTLKELHLKERENELNEISKLIDTSTSTLLKKQREILEKFLKSDIKISTIDSFLTSILRQFAFNASIGRDFEIGTLYKEKFFISFLQKVHNRKLYKSLLHLSIYENSKLEMLFDLFEKLYEKDSEIRDITFSQKSFDEKEIITLAKTLEDEFLYCKDLSKTAKNQLKNGSFKELQTRSWICKESLSDYRYFKKCANSHLEEIFQKLKVEIKRYFKEYEELFFYRLFELYKIYKEEAKTFKRKNNKFEFNDIANFVYDVLNSIDSDFLYFRLDSKIDHILLDEFQDTSILQYRILEPILKEISSGIGIKEFRSIFYVGDVKQSIYRFRGGTKELFSYMQKELNIKREVLNRNYRSYKRIVDFVNETFENRIREYQRQISTDKKNRGFVEVVKSEDILEEIKKRVEELIERGISLEDITILTHTNSDSITIQEFLTEKLQIKVTTESSMKLINHRGVKALIEFIKYLYFEKEYFKANFLALIGRDFNQNFELPISKRESLDKIFNRVIEYFQIKVDKSLLKFIEISFYFKDIEDFIYNYEHISENIDKEESDGVKILTIHKSKGLEFDNVIVCDKIGRKSNYTQSIIYEYENIFLTGIYKRTKQRECFDEEYKRAVEKERILSQEDEVNTHYVAFTRAKNSLFIITKERNSIFDYLDLEVKKEGKIEIPKREKREKSYQKIFYEKLNLGFQEDKLKVEEENGNNHKAIYFGLATHYLLEIIYKFDKKHLKKALLNTKNRYHLFLSDREFLDIEKRVDNLFKNSFFQNLIKNHKNIYKEQPLIFNKELKQIDLLIEKENEYIIIDYKTSPKEMIEHKKQVINYKKAIGKISNKKSYGYLCYLRENEIKFVEI